MRNIFKFGWFLPLAFIVAQASVPYMTTPQGPLTYTIASGGTAVTVFNGSSIPRWATVENPPTATETLYVDFTGVAAVAGSGTAFAISPGQAFTVAGPITTSVSAVAATSSHTFVAVRY